MCFAKEGIAIGFGIVFLESPVWIGENCRPELRGFFLCIMNGSIVLGQFLLSFVFQTSFHDQLNLQFADVFQKAPLQSKESGHMKSLSSSNLPLLVGILLSFQPAPLLSTLSCPPRCLSFLSRIALLPHQERETRTSPKSTRQDSRERRSRFT
jgi:hypothetical protein